MELYILQSKSVFGHHLGGLNDELSSWHLPLPFSVCGRWATIPGDRTRKKGPTEARSLFLCLIDQRITVVLYLFNQLVNSVIFLSSLLQVISKVLVHLNPSTQYQYQTYKYWDLRNVSARVLVCDLSQILQTKNCMTDSKENYKWDLGSWGVVRILCSIGDWIEGLLGYYVALEIEKLSGYRTEFFFYQELICSYSSVT